MLKRCEECGYEYSSYAEKCPRCYYPNRHVLHHMDLEYAKDEAKFSIFKSLISIVLFFIFTYLLKKYGGLSPVVATFIAAIFSSIMTATGAGIILTLIIIMGLGYFFSEVVHLPNFLEELSVYIFVLFPIYYMVVRPIWKIISILKINHKINKVHTDDVEI